MEAQMSNFAKFFAIAAALFVAQPAIASSPEMAELAVEVTELELEHTVVLKEHEFEAKKAEHERAIEQEELRIRAESLAERTKQDNLRLEAKLKAEQAKRDLETRKFERAADRKDIDADRTHMLATRKLDGREANDDWRRTEKTLDNRVDRKGDESKRTLREQQAAVRNEIALRKQRENERKADRRWTRDLVKDGQKVAKTTVRVIEDLAELHRSR